MSKPRQRSKAARLRRLSRSRPCRRQSERARVIWHRFFAADTNRMERQAAIAESLEKKWVSAGLLTIGPLENITFSPSP